MGGGWLLVTALIYVLWVAMIATCRERFVEAAALLILAVFLVGFVVLAGVGS